MDQPDSDTLPLDSIVTIQSDHTLLMRMFKLAGQTRINSSIKLNTQSPLFKFTRYPRWATHHANIH
ncbi:MAG: hypothetical protein B6D78_16370 [gamma proteobacterium symbiont of Ctena orbiculata]|nr:MAG: hypothetical protein B6D78_16370 [gamma proteobacterium symbiont of Ctena orbiculata]